MKQNNNALLQKLCKDLVLIDDPGVMYRFLKDLITPHEQILLSKRWMICKLVVRGDLNYELIASITGTSTTTVTRVARFLKKEHYKGYRFLVDQKETTQE